MKRLTIRGVPISLHIAKWALLVIILAALPVVCLAQYQQKVRVKQVEKVQPPEPRLKGPVSLEQTIAKRRSVREFTSQPLDFEQLGQLAWAGQDITEKQKTRTLQQNKFVHVLFSLYGVEAGYTLEEAKTVLKKRIHVLLIARHMVNRQR